ncbi:MAG: ATP-binding protein [Phormidesmis sp.]
MPVNKTTGSETVQIAANNKSSHEGETEENRSLEQEALVEEIAELREQVVTLEELLQVYEESATEQSERLQGMLNDLQEKAQQLGHAQEALQTLQGILHSIGDAVIVLGADGQDLFVNPAAKQLLGGQSLEVSFQHWLEDHCIFDGDGDTLHSFESLPMARALRGESVDAEEIRVLSPGGDRTQWLSVTARPILNEKAINKNVTNEKAASESAASKKGLGAVAVLRDVTEHKAFEVALQQSNNEAQQQARLLENTLHELKQTQSQLIHGEKMASLGKTVAGIAHEINNPVSFIHGNLAHMARAFDDLLLLARLFQSVYLEPSKATALPTCHLPAYQKIAQAIEDIDVDFLAKDIPAMLDSMTAGTDRIRNIVRSLRVFARLDEAEVKTVEICQGIDSAIMIVQSQLKDHPTRPDIALYRQYVKNPLIECHARQLNQVFVHLLSNAIDALSTQPDIPQITVRTQADKSELTIEIEDNGQGIPAEIQPKIFDPFFTTKPVGTGTGLGLSMCHQIIVSMHRGSIECFSEVGKGSRFVVKLPI